MKCPTRVPLLFALGLLALAASGRGEVVSFPGRDPRLLWDAAGRLHVVYVENRADGPAAFYRRLGKDPAGPVRVRGGRTAVAFTCHPGEESKVVVADWADLLGGASVPECAAATPQAVKVGLPSHP